MPVWSWKHDWGETVEIRIVSIEGTIRQWGNDPRFYKISQVRSGSPTVFGRVACEMFGSGNQNNDIPNSELEPLLQEDQAHQTKQGTASGFTKSIKRLRRI